jgi:tRNA A58 N-methylase Trm61
VLAARYSLCDLNRGNPRLTAIHAPGTGSGSFSHSLARTVGDQGKVHSFEYHEERFEKAK